MSIEILTLRQFRYFIAVAETGSVTGAARQVGISQSAITAAIQALQEETGARLVERHQKGLRLTHEGHQFLQHARHIVASIADARRAVGMRNEQMQGDLNLGVTHLVSGYYLANVLARFRRVYANVRIEVIETERGHLEHLLVNGELDVGLLLTSNLEDADALQSEILLRSPWRVWLPLRHPLLSFSVLTLRQVASERWITLSIDEMAETTARWWGEAGLDPDVCLRTSSVEALRSLVATGAGIAAMPELAYRQWSLDGDRIEARHLDDDIRSVDVGLAWRKGSSLRPAARRFVEMVGEFCDPVAPRAATA